MILELADAILKRVLICGEIVQTERHTYEKCQYEEFKKRVAKMDEMRAAKVDEKRILEQ